MKRATLAFLACLAAQAGPVSAQSPFAGTYTGTQSVTSTASCSCTSGNCASFVATTATCNFSQPWTGVVDSQGNLTVSLAAGTETCNPGNFSEPVAASGPTPSGTVPSSGSLSVPLTTTTTNASGTSVTVTCSAYTFQFTPSGVASNWSCTDNSTTMDPTGAFTSSCTGNVQYSLNASSGSGGAGVLVPPKVVFPITVNSTITPTTASATAQITPPSTVVGTLASVYVFAHARLSALTSLKDGGTSDPCVLAQLNSSGQLTAASASSMQAYTTNTISSQSQAVTILNNVSTPSVAGATFLVGYGSSPSSMLSSGTYEGAVSVNGSSPCSAALLAGAAPNSPSALSGLWWNPGESGWGVSFTQRRNIVFGAWYTYDSAGKPKWYVASNCTLPSGVTGTAGTCTGSLYQVTGPTYFGTPFNPSRDLVASVGSLTVAFQDANTAMMTYSVDGQSRTVPITRQLFQSGTTPPAIDYTDLWWNPNESGWGMVITQQYGVMFLAWYVYDDAGNPVWYVAPDCVVVGSACTGSVYSTVGPPLGPSFDPNAVHATAVGTITATFADANNASLSYTVNGVSGTKQITRQTF